MACGLSQAAGPQDVIARRSRTLADALRVAISPALREGRRREVAIIVDVTPYTQRGEKALIEALIALRSEAGAAAGWRVAPLGHSLSKAFSSPVAIAMQIPRVLGGQTRSVNTLRDLRRTLSTFPVRGGVAVFLADWHFEDDQRLEPLVSMLRARGQVLSTVGSEAAFQRGWNDGLFPQSGGRRLSPRAKEGYDVRIGRNPFGANEARAPWHGGDTAYPPLPGYFGGADWLCEFSAAEALREEEQGPLQAQSPEDLRERLHMQKREESPDTGRHPLPSAWGPYGLMRLAAETGGRYVLWSWNPSGRSQVTYDYSRCDLFPPDLRSRRAILAEIAHRPLARALMKAWHQIADRRVAIARVTPPLDTDLRSPRPIKTVRGGCGFCGSFNDRAELLALLRRAPRVLEGIDRALKTLDTAVDRTKTLPRGPDRRLLADAHLLRHILLVQRFSLGEFLELAKRIPRNAWDRPDRWLTVFPDIYLTRGADPEHVVPRTTRIFDAKRGMELVEDRKRMLRRYAGTPYAEMVARNRVYAYRLTWCIRVPRDPGAGLRTPAESGGEGETTPKPTPGGSGGSSGATSGG